VSGAAPERPDGPSPYAITFTHPDGRVEVMYDPLPHQLAFHLASEPNVLMEGGRGTGKSLAIRMDAHTRALKWPGFTYLILRRTMPELRKSHLHYIEAEMKKFGPGHFYHKTENVAYYTNGSRGYFAHCETEADILNFLSSQFGAIYFDELSTFSLNMFLQISSSARAPEDADYVAVVRGGTNPLGEGAGWVKTWFIPKNVNLADFPDYHPADFRAIHSVYTDNPHLNQEAYRQRLASLPAHERKAWLDGEWIESDGYFADWLPTRSEEYYDEKTERMELRNVAWHVIDELPTVKGLPLLEQRWISVYRVLDWGFHPDPAVCIWIAVLPNKRAIAFKERQWLKTTAAEVAGDIVNESRGMRVLDTLCDPSMFVASKATEGMSIGDIFDINGVPLTPSLNDRAAAGLAIHEWLNTVIDEQPKLQVLREGCPNLIRTFPEMRIDKNDPRRIADGEDHYVISLGYFCMSWVSASNDPERPAIPRWMQQPTGTRKPIGARNVRARVA
jgi:hypothetical protein